jgi:gliding motility-associated-like protein
MEIDPNSCCTVFLPNAFTPNGDGRNDFFRPIYNGYHHFHVFQIMNRWGQIIFTAENNNVQWDGNYNGVPQDMGVYYYYLKYDCGGKTIEEKGDVTLIR